MDLVGSGGLAVLGNHDNADGVPRENLDVEAQVAMEWTRGELGLAERRFLEELPLSLTDGGRLYVHADASDPKRWPSSVDVAGRSMMATSADVTFCGHVRRPGPYPLGHRKGVLLHARDGLCHSVAAEASLACRARFGRQPADGNPAAAYAILDTERLELTYCRVPYDIDAAAAKIRAKGLPTWLTESLMAWESETWPHHRMDRAQSSTASASKNASITAVWPPSGVYRGKAPRCS